MPAPFSSENKEALKACQPLSLKYLDSLQEFMKKNQNSFVYPTPNHINNGMASDHANHPVFISQVQPAEVSHSLVLHCENV